jgi:hypothetical protein
MFSNITCTKLCIISSVNHRGTLLHALALYLHAPDLLSCLEYLHTINMLCPLKHSFSLPHGFTVPNIFNNFHSVPLYNKHSLPLTSNSFLQ